MKTYKLAIIGCGKVAQLYKIRWRIETFFKLLKQNLQIKTFIGTSENACKSQIFIALICYLLLECARKGDIINVALASY